MRLSQEMMGFQTDMCVAWKKQHQDLGDVLMKTQGGIQNSTEAAALQILVHGLQGKRGIFKFNNTFGFRNLDRC